LKKRSEMGKMAAGNEKPSEKSSNGVMVKKKEPNRFPNWLNPQRKNGGSDETRTRDLRRDRLQFGNLYCE
jgi:hypothetical protein